MAYTSITNMRMNVKKQEANAYFLTPQLARQLGCPMIVLDHMRVYLHYNYINYMFVGITMLIKYMLY